MAEYCDTPQSKERTNREYEACLNERAILRLLDHPDICPTAGSELISTHGFNGLLSKLSMGALRNMFGALGGWSPDSVKQAEGLCFNDKFDTLLEIGRSGVVEH
jgi:hypothetical protein